MNIADLITLAKAGYTPAQVKELMQLDNNVTKPEPETVQPEEPQGQTGEDKDNPGSPEPIVHTVNATDPNKVEDSVDYKALYEQSQAALKKAQEANVSKPAQIKPDTSEETLKDIFRSYV